MRRRIITTALAAMSAVAIVATPATAHVNDAKAAHVAEHANARQGGTPLPGFIGPVEAHIGSRSYVKAHSGMECGALSSPNITALGPAGIGFDERFVCPAGK
jgi:hypothetical protein